MKMVVKLENLDIKDSMVFINDSFETVKGDKPATMEALKTGNIGIDNIVYNMGAESVTIDEILITDGQFFVESLPNGDLNLDLFTNIGVSSSSNVEDAITESTDEPPFLVQITKLGVDDFSVLCRNIVDGQDKDIVVDVVSVKGKNISTKPDSKANIEMISKINGTASIDVSGELCIDPVSANMKMNISDIDLSSFQPFIGYFIEDAPKITISSGKFSSDGAFSFALSETDVVTGGFKGDLSISELLISDHNNEQLAGFGDLNIKGSDVQIEPISVNVRSIALNKFKCFASLHEDGSINFMNIFPEIETEEIPEEDSSVEVIESSKKDLAMEFKEELNSYLKAYPVNLSELSIDESNISFVDYSIKPNFSIEISDIYGKVTNFSTEKASDAVIDAGAKINSYADGKIGGSINLFEEKPFAKLTVALKGLDLTPFSPYTGKYIGYSVRKGKLSLDLSYMVELVDLDSLNNFIS